MICIHVLGGVSGLVSYRFFGYNSPGSSNYGLSDFTSLVFLGLIDDSVVLGVAAYRRPLLVSEAISNWRSGTI